jgi:hypothetical protein
MIITMVWTQCKDSNTKTSSSSSSSIPT